MKRLLTLAALFLCCIATSFAQFSGSGSGTENDPYLILNPIQFNQLRNFLNKEKVYFKLMADIDLTEFLEDEYGSQGWMPIGTESQPFKGFLDGNEKTISGLEIDRSESDYVGLFGYTYGAYINNLIIQSASIKGKDNVGVLVGCFSNSSILNCTLSGEIYGNTYVGGCIGSGSGIKVITGISSSVKVVGKGSTGGIIGQAWSYNSQINNCKVKADIFGGDYTGGICGVSSNSIISNCCYIGYIKANSYVGGIVGQHNTNNIQDSYVLGDIDSNGNMVGGIVGRLIGDLTPGYYIKNCFFNGNLNSVENVGGIVGYCSGECSVSKCYSNATINAFNNLGGICGYAYGKNRNYSVNINKCITYNQKISITEGSGIIGRIMGTSSGSVKVGEIGNTSDENKSLNRTIVIKAGVVQDVIDNERNGTGVSPTTLKLKATYVAMGWDFNDIWEIQETECYPYFKTQTAPPVITSEVVSGATTISGKCVDGGTVTLEIDGVTQQMVSTGHEFSFSVSPLQAGHEVRVSAKAEGKEQSYFTTEIVSFLGKGTESDPYQVYTAADLTCAYRKGYYKQMNDIDLTDYINQYCGSEGWESIGREGSETIHFDGDGHKITGLWCNSTRDNTGLFSCFANGYIKNLTVETAKGKQVKGGNYTGIIIGKLINGEMIDCKAFGTVADGTPVGGMLGKLDGGKLLRCQADVTINVSGGNSYIGGLAGEVTGDVDECLSNGTLTATGSNSYVGGLIGLNNSGSNVTNCYSNAVTNSSLCAAGLVAYNYGLVEKSYATGDIYSKNYGAGIIGYNDGAGAIVRNCVATSNKIEVLFESQSAQSGGYGQRIIGGIKNGAPAPELNNYALKTMQVSLNNVPQKVYDDIMNGVAKTGVELMKGSTYQELGWDFSHTWSITEGESYPSLTNNPAAVGKAEEEEPEPVVSTDDKISVDEVSVATGKTVAIGINLNNITTDFTAYQFNLTLPTGFTLATDSKGKYQVTKTSRYEDDGQSLSVSLQEDGSYKFVSFSLSNGKIEGISGAILNAIISAAGNVKAGTYEASISNIIFTRLDGTQYKLNDAKFNIFVNNIIMGDANGDGEVNVTDIVEIVNYIMSKPSAKFVRTAADMNNDGEINVTDIVLVVNVILKGNSGKARSMVAVSQVQTDNDRLSLTEKDDRTFALCLDNQGGYVASQFELRLSEGQKLENIQISSSRSKGHQLTYAEVGRNVYKVMLFSLENQAYEGNNGELLTISVSGNGQMELDDILFVTEAQTEKRFAPLNGQTTGINSIESINTSDIYSVDGRLLRRQASSTSGLDKGIYIINGKKHIVK